MERLRENDGRPSTGLSTSPRPKLRSCSMKKPRRQFTDDLDEMRPRTCSLPTKNCYARQQYLSPTVSTEGGLHRVRSFERTSKGIINRGDSFRSRSTNSIASSCSSATDNYPLSRSPSVNSQGSTEASVGSSGGHIFKVCVLGSPGVGKTALMQQFTTSDYVGGFDTSLDGEPEKIVSVLLDGEESDLSFLEIDSTAQTDVPDEIADSYVVIYSITSRKSFDNAVDILYKLRKQDCSTASIIMAANKSDLVRTRQVTNEEAKSVAKTYECKFIETSIVLNHHVDELLVGVLSQLRLKHERSQKRSTGSPCYKQGARCLMDKLFRKDGKSCENLYAL